MTNLWSGSLDIDLKINIEVLSGRQSDRGLPVVFVRKNVIEPGLIEKIFILPLRVKEFTADIKRLQEK